MRPQPLCVAGSGMPAAVTWPGTEQHNPSAAHRPQSKRDSDIMVCPFTSQRLCAASKIRKGARRTHAKSDTRSGTGSGVRILRTSRSCVLREMPDVKRICYKLGLWVCSLSPRERAQAGHFCPAYASRFPCSFMNHKQGSGGWALLASARSLSAESVEPKPRAGCIEASPAVYIEVALLI